MADETRPKQYFMQHEQMDFEIQIMLGSCYYGCADAGEVLSTIERIQEGDFESWYGEWYATAERLEGVARQCATDGNNVSARRAYLRAACYYAACLSMIDGTDDPSRRVPTWKKHMACFDDFYVRLDPPAEKVEIPYERTPMPGYLFKPAAAGGPFATIIFNNPGQNAMLWLHGVPFRPDWENVITPVVDFLSARPEVDSTRIAAGIADPDDEQFSHQHFGVRSQMLTSAWARRIMDGYFLKIPDNG